MVWQEMKGGNGRAVGGEGGEEVVVQNTVEAG